MKTVGKLGGGGGESKKKYIKNIEKIFLKQFGVNANTRVPNR